MRVGEIQSQANAQRWLVEGLWGVSVGVIGGAPKSAKTWLGLDMASVATGTACLGNTPCRSRAGAGLPGRGRTVGRP